MVFNHYCQDCDNYNNRRCKTEHINSKTNLHMYYNIITKKYNIGDVYWCDFEETIREYMVNNSCKLNFFLLLLNVK